MKNLLKRILKNKLLIIIFTIVFCLIATTTTFAIVITNSTRGQIEGNTIEVNATADFTLASNNSTITFNKEKDNDSIQVKITNNSESVLHYYYKLSFTSDNDLSKAILVSHNNNFIKTLNQFTDTDNTIEDEYAFLGVGVSKTEDINFELHEAIKGSLLDTKTLNITLEVYTTSANYVNYMFVSNEDEYLKAIDDINDDLLTNSQTPTIVLLNNIILSSSPTLLKECNLVLNGNSINGTTILNSTSALMNIIGDDASKVSSFNLTLTSYNEEKAATLVANILKEKLKYGIVTQDSIMNLTGTMLPYKSLVSKVGSNYNYLENDTLFALNVTNDEVESIKVGTEDVEFIIYSATTNIDKYLSHLPSEDEITTTDIYLPTNISSLNASIEWTSSNLELMDNQGKIVTNYADVDPITFYAKIKVNNQIYTKSYSFKLSVHNNEVNFSNLISEISPLVIYTSYNGSNEDSAYYYLPIVDENSDYDYRKDYTTPKDDFSYTWKASRDILLTKLEYSLITDDDGNETYDYIKLANDNAVYLNGDTLNTYAQILVTGYFNTGEKYSTAVNINIAVGTETEILEPAFKNVQEYVNDVDVLYSLISSRIENGMGNEKATFKLPSYYYNDPNEFNITYTIPSSSEDVITSIEAASDGSKFYEITLDPTAFAKTESTISLEVTVSFNDRVVKTRNLYFVVPAILKTSDVGNSSLFNTIKYQVFNNLPDNEKVSDTGFSVSGNVITNNTPDYILIRDIVGDAKYKSTYITNYDETTGYLAKLEYSESNYVTPIETLKFYVNDTSNASSSKDALAYDFTRLISWATSTAKVKVSSLGLTSSSSISSYLDTLSDGKEYLTDDEIAVLKAFYENTTSKTNWDTIWSEVVEKAPGYVFTDTTNLNSVITDVLTNAVISTKRSKLYFKYNEVVQVVLNKKDHYENNSEADGGILYFPNFGIIGKRNWITSYNSNYYEGFTDGKGNTWYYQDVGSGFGNAERYKEDNTDYISEIELEIMKVFWLNALSNKGDTWTNLSSVSNYQKQIVDAFDASVTWPQYFVSGGIGKLINYYYDAASIKVDKTNGYQAYAKDGVPTITNMDSLNAIFNYFTSLKTLIVEGNSDLSAFLDSYSLSTFFNKLTTQNTTLENLTMKYVANDYVEFDISNIKELDNLKTINISNNEGLTNTAYLVNINSDNYTSVNFQNIGTQYEFLEYTIHSLSSATCTVSYTTDEGHNAYTNQVFTTNKSLTYLNEFDKLIAENMYLVDKIYESSATDYQQIYWRIDSGNKITSIETAGKYNEIDSVSAMNNFVSPYYLATSTFTFNGVTFTKNHVYKILSSGTSISITELKDANNVFIEVTNVDNVDDETLKSYVSQDDIMNNYETISSDSEVEITELDPTYGNINTTSSNNVIATASTNYYTLRFNYFRLYYNNTSSKYGRNRQYYIYTSSSSKLSLSSNSNSDSDICFLTAEEANKLVNNSFTTSDVQNNTITLGTTSFPSSTTINDSNIEYYIYFPYYNVFLSITNGDYSLSSTPTNMCKIYNSSNLYYIYNASNTSNLSNTYFLKYKSYSIDVSTGVSNGFTLSSSSSSKYSSSSQTTIQSSISFNLYDKSGKIIYQKENVYQLGYDIITTTKTSNYKESYYSDEFYYEQSMFFYYNGNVYLTTFIYDDYAERSRNYYCTETLTTYMFYYKETSSGTKQTINLYNVDSYDYSLGINSDSGTVSSASTNKSDYTYGEWSDGSTSFDYDTWNNDFINSHKDTYDSSKLFVENSIYISYVNEADNSKVITNRKSLMQEVKSGAYDTTYYLYTGTTGNEEIHKENTSASTSTTYNNGYGYLLYIDSNNELAWKEYGTLSQNTSSTTMDSILETANSHLNDSQFGMYYGMYYAYSGETMISDSGNLYEQYHIYRIVLNDTNTAFIYEDSGKSYTSYTDATTLLYQIVEGTLGTNDIGNVYYIKGSGEPDTYAAGFYTLTYDADANSYGLMKFTHIDYDYSSLKLLNRSVYNENNNYLDQNDNNDNYGGTGGSYEVVIEAFIKDDSGNIISRKFKITVTG